MLSVSLLLHQPPSVVWLDLSLDECHDLVDLHNRQNGGEPADGGVEEAHEFDLEQIRALKAENEKKAK